VSRVPFLQVQIFSELSLRNLIAVPLFVIGLTFIIWSNIDLFRIGGGGPADGFDISISPRTQRLVVTGPYKYSRNPMAFGANTMYLSLALYLNTLLTLLFVVALFSLAILYLKFSEEKRLVRDFGDEFLQYKARVSMIIPLPPSHSFILRGMIDPPKRLGETILIWTKE